MKTLLQTIRHKLFPAHKALVSEGHEAKRPAAREFIPSPVASARKKRDKNARNETTATLTRFIPPIYVFLLFSLLSGCGPQNESPAGGTNGAASGGKTTVRLAFFPNVTHGVALVGTGSGAFAKALGSDVKIEEQVFTAGPAEIEALFAGQVDIGYIGPGPAVNGFLKSRGKALRIVAGAASGGAALVVRKDAGIVDIKGLAGKRVAIPQIGGTQDIALRHALQQVGLTSTDKGGNVTVIATAPADALTLFQKKELDAAWTAEPWVARLAQEGNGEILVDERDEWPGQKFATTVVIMRTEFLEKNPELAKKFLEAHADTVEWIGKNRSEAQKLIGERIKQLTTKALPDAILSDALSRTEFTTDPLKETVLETANRARALGYQREDAALLKDLFDLKIP